MSSRCLVVVLALATLGLPASAGAQTSEISRVEKMTRLMEEIYEDAEDEFSSIEREIVDVLEGHHSPSYTNHELHHDHPNRSATISTYLRYEGRRWEETDWGTRTLFLDFVVTDHDSPSTYSHYVEDPVGDTLEIVFNEIDMEKLDDPSDEHVQPESRSSMADPPGYELDFMIADHPSHVVLKRHDAERVTELWFEAKEQVEEMISAKKGLADLEARPEFYERDSEADTSGHEEDPAGG